jgi:NAD(P)-dependent dehydrogenase (short-subunit alcohol dehydrogenase family)
MTDLLRFDGRIALVTGAGGGLGRAHARLLAERGASVVVNELHEGLGKAEAVVAEIEAAGGTAIAVAGRIGLDADARNLVEHTVSRFGRIDIVVNNAGTVGGKTIVQEDPGPGFQRELDIHLLGALQVNRAAWPHMAGQRYGRILFTGSSVAFGWYREPAGYEGSYASAKSAIFGAARQTAAAGEEFGIKANILLPHAYTPMVDSNLRGTKLGTWMAAHLRAEQVAASAALLLHEECPVNGQAISAGGGRVARVFFATTRGYFNPGVTPEDVRQNWDAIAGVPAPDASIPGMIELRSQPHEHEIMNKLLTSVASAPGTEPDAP